MRRTRMTLLGAAALMWLTGCATPTQRPLLWEIAGPRPSYVYGTIHLPDARVSALPAVVRAALADADVYFAEIPLTAEVQKQLDLRSRLPKQQKLRDVLPAETYAHAERYFRAHGVGLGAFADRRIWFVAMTAELLDEVGAFIWHTPLDQDLWNRARALHKELGGLETLDEQLGVFEQFTPEEQAAYLEATLVQLDEQHAQQARPARDLLEAYLRGDEAELQQMLDETTARATDDLSRRLYAALITERNARMAERIQKRLVERPHTSYFFAVGAGHVVGADGVLARLRAGGLQVRRLGPEDTERVATEHRIYLR